jgi:hypothetical protein
MSFFTTPMIAISDRWRSEESLIVIVETHALQYI